MNKNFLNSYSLPLIGKLSVLAFGFFIFSVGCGNNNAQRPSELAVVVPTPLQTRADVVDLPADGLPPVIVTAESINHNQNEIRPTWTPLPVGTVRGACEQPAGWTSYRVQAGNTLSEIAKWSGSTIDELAEVNCVADVRRIEIGQVVFVPNGIVPTKTPSVTATSIPTETPAASATPNTQTRIDFFYIDDQGTEIPSNREVMLRWQVVGTGEFILSWEHESYAEPVVLQRGEQGEYSQTVELPDILGTILLTLRVFDEDGRQTEQTVEIELP